MFILTYYYYYYYYKDKKRNCSLIILHILSGNLPAHLACKHTRTKLWVNIVEISLTLLSAYPESLTEHDGNGFLPIELAFRNRGPEDLIMALLVNYPECIKRNDKYGNSLVHLAGENFLF